MDKNNSTGTYLYEGMLNFINHQKKNKAIKISAWLKWKTLKMPNVAKGIEYSGLSYTASEMIHW